MGLTGNDVHQNEREALFPCRNRLFFFGETGGFLYEQETRVWCGFYLAIYWDLYYNDAENRIVIDGELVRAERKDHLRPTDLIWIMPT